MTTPQQMLERSAAARAHDEEAALTRTAFVGFATIVIREFNRIIRIWGQTIVPPAITATLYFVIFGSLIGRRIGDMGGYTYIQYIAPGLIMTDMLAGDPRLETLERSVPVGRLGQPAEVADVIVAVARNAYMTGQTVSVDGGRYPR